MAAVRPSDVRQDMSGLDALIESILEAGRIPGAGIAIVIDGEVRIAKSYGYRDAEARLPATAHTIYPIASTTKAMNATLLGLLVEDGLLAWDAPVQKYLPRFQLGSSLFSSEVTLRDLLTMRTGLPRHDWLWLENPSTRSDVIARLQYLELSAPFRERFQYNNLTSTTAGHVAEVVTGRSWEDLLQERILEPLSMHATTFGLPMTGEVTQSYHENRDRELKLTQRLETDVTAPSGGSIHSTVSDMARWLIFNLNGGRVDERVLMKPETLKEIHAPQVVAGLDPGAPTPHAMYALGWFVHLYNGFECWSHGGYLHDVSSDVLFCPERRIGIVSFANFGFPTLSKLMNQHVFDWFLGLEHVQTVGEKLGEYEKKIADIQQRDAGLRRIENTSPAHPVGEYAGEYTHPGYGQIRIQRNGEDLVFQRNRLVLPLQHWHYEAWIAKDSGMFFLHTAHAFDRASRFVFETNENGEVAAVLIRLEPAVAPIRFVKQ